MERLFETWNTYDIMVKTEEPWHFVLNEIEAVIMEERKVICFDFKYESIGGTQSGSSIRQMKIGPFMTKEEAERYIHNDLQSMINKYGKNDTYSMAIIEEAHVSRA